MTPTNHFGSWNEAKEAAGLGTDIMRSPEKSKHRYVKDVKKDLSCEFCDEDFYACLSFHHVDPTDKVGSVTEMKNAPYADYDIDDIKEEIAKCVTLCSNCHRKVHCSNHELEL